MLFQNGQSLILFVSVVSSRLSLPQTFQQVEEGEEADHELSAEKKSPIVKSASLRRRKSTKGSFAASEGEKEEKEKSQQDKTEEVNCG